MLMMIASMTAFVGVDKHWMCAFSPSKYYDYIKIASNE